MTEYNTQMELNGTHSKGSKVNTNITNHALEWNHNDSQSVEDQIIPYLAQNSAIRPEENCITLEIKNHRQIQMEMILS